MRNVYFVSLGCDKNLVDSEKMLSVLASAGWRITDQPEEADAAVINSCCFIDDAKEESINTILELADYKESGRLRVLIVAGCLRRYLKWTAFWARLRWISCCRCWMKLSKGRDRRRSANLTGCRISLPTGFAAPVPTTRI